MDWPLTVRQLLSAISARRRSTRLTGACRSRLVTVEARLSCPWITTLPTPQLSKADLSHNHDFVTKINCRNQASLQCRRCQALFDNTSACTRTRAPFRSSGRSAAPTKARLVIVSGQELGPTHSSLRSTTAIMITNSDSPVQGSRLPNQLLGVVLHTIA